MKLLLAVVSGILLLGLGLLAQTNPSGPIYTQIRGPNNTATMGSPAAPFPSVVVGLSYEHINTVGAFPVKTTSGTLSRVIVSTFVSGMAVDIYDVPGAACTGIPASIFQVAHIEPVTNGQRVFDYVVFMGNGICILNNRNTDDITVVYNNVLNY